ncbi:unnamed protein product [Ectocarpus sp. 12 AP-2014]
MTTWDGSGMSQEDFMVKDEVIALDEDDQIVGHVNKYLSHRFVPGTPRGILHRAFSVFLFDQDGKLLLQKRAASKITFPNVWTNTCCSHPLYGYERSEVDKPEDLKDGSVPGVKNAAVRKLAHELGIAAEDVPIDSFKFLTRLHYYAADAVTHGPNAPWGEHEIDYILFIQVDSSLSMTPHPDEVDAVKWVSVEEMDAMMNDNANLWSPWFRIIMERFAREWWLNLNDAINTDKYMDTVNIHRFDPPAKHRGGAGVTGLVEEGAKAATIDKSKKQGAYGKVPTIKAGKLAQLSHVDEVFAALWFKARGAFSNNLDQEDSDVAFCNDMLGKVSRSFAAVIRQLPKMLATDIVVFYLVLRGLDTVEDDMTAFEDIQVKIKLLTKFHETALVDRAWKLEGVGQGDERVLLERFSSVTAVFQSLSQGSQEVISDITKRMGAGMAEFVSKDLGQGTTSTVDYDKYCHYVAGLVGDGLTRLFVATGIEGQELLLAPELANSMGLFLQKTNIIRDYLEDYVDGRAFWPQDVWKKHAKTGQLGEFALPQFRDNALACLNELVTDALALVPDCLAYMRQIKDPEVFRFCAIPQVMAIATLAEIYNNPDVFRGVVKIRKGLACRMILESGDLEGIFSWFNKLAEGIAARVPALDPCASRTTQVCKIAVDMTTPTGKALRTSRTRVVLYSVPVLLSAAYLYRR